MTAGGKKIAPQPIENALKQSDWISLPIVIGNRRKFLSALIVPNFGKTGAAPGDSAALDRDASLRAGIQGEIDRTTRARPTTSRSAPSRCSRGS